MGEEISVNFCITSKTPDKIWGSRPAESEFQRWGMITYNLSDFGENWKRVWQGTTLQELTASIESALGFSLRL